MTRKNISEAIGNVSDRHIEEVMNFQKKMEEVKMEKRNNKKSVWFKWKPATVAAALALFVCVSGATALAATGVLQGFFEDVFRLDGAVIGTTYEQATDEIGVTVTEVSNQLVVELVMQYPDKVPYSELEKLGIENYEIVDMNGEVVAEGNATEAAEVADGKVSVGISLDNISSGSYKLVISEISGEKKADQSLILRGTWECDFIK